MSDPDKTDKDTHMSLMKLGCLLLFAAALPSLARAQAPPAKPDSPEVKALIDIPAGDSLLVVSTEVIDPTYLLQPFWTSTHFKKQNDGTGWNPTPCSVE